VNILIVGAGAVGQVYGRHLALGGAHVHYFVRERHAAECRRGFVFHPLNRPARDRPVRQEVAPGDVLTTMAEVKAIAWDQVYLCVSSAGLRGAWLGELAASIGDATVVSLQPGLEDRDHIAQVVAADRIVSGMITLISFATPMPGEHVEVPGMAYWFPPLMPAPFSGPRPRTQAVVEALRRGGLPSKIGRDVPAEVTFPSVVLMTLLTALEAASWRFRDLVRGDRLRQVRAATLEAFAITARAHRQRPPRLLRLVVRPLPIRILLAVARRVMPFDLETYMHVHFTKVRDQTRLHMASYLASGERLGLPTTALAALERSVGEPAGDRAIG
jgi:2-dehydropantoate 2-reductase